jgi:hypothetical protein
MILCYSLLYKKSCENICSTIKRTKIQINKSKEIEQQKWTMEEKIAFFKKIRNLFFIDR